MKKVLLALLSLIIIVVCVLYVSRHADDFRNIFKISYLNLSILVLTNILYIIGNGLILYLGMKAFNIDLGIKEWFGLTVLTNLGNYLTFFKAGMSVKAIYLKTKYKFPFSSFISYLAVSYIVTLIIGTVFGATALVLIQKKFTLIFWILVLILLFLLCTLFLPIPKVFKKKNKINEVINRIIEGRNILKSNRKILFWICIIFVMHYTISTLQLYVSYGALGYTVALLPVFLISSLYIFSIVISVTPGNIGVQEAAISFISQFSTLGFREGAVVSTLIRVTGMLVTFTLGPVFSYILLRGRK